MSCENGIPLMEEFKEYIRYFDYGKYIPFYHGTTMEIAKEIMVNGLLTRSENPKSSGAGKWGETGTSQEDLVYFITCMERSSVAVQACKRMLYLPEQKEEKDCAFIELVNYKKYQDYFTIDEDSKSVPLKIKGFFSEKLFRWGGEAISVLKKLERGFARFYERGFVVGGGDLVAGMIDATPSAIFSIADWGTFAIARSISPEDLKVVSYDVYRKREDCRKKTGYHDLDEKAYYDFARKHDAEQATIFKRMVF